MGITNDEIKWYRSAVVTNTVANGGKMSNNQIVTNVRRNVFPDVSQKEREDGITRYRKLFVKIANADNDVLYNSLLHFITITPAEDYVTLFQGTQVDTQNDISSPTEYGIGNLNANVSAGGNEIQVLLENTSIIGFRTGDSIWIGDGTNEEYHENVSVSKTGTVVTITLDTGDQLTNGYNTSNTFVACCLDIGDIEGEVSGWTETSSGSGVYDETTYPVTVHSIGGVYDVWTITFTSAINFGCSGAATGNVGTGNINTLFAPNNPAFSQPYFLLDSNGFTGTWANGDIIQFTTSPAAVPIWFKQIVPAGSNSHTANNFSFRITGESS